MSEATLPRPLDIKQGDTFILNMLWEDEDGNPIDTAGCTAKMQLRRTYGSPVLHELSTENGGIVLGLGTINLRIESEDTENLSGLCGKFDLQITYPSGDIETILGGNFNIVLEITK